MPELYDILVGFTAVFRVFVLRNKEIILRTPVHTASYPHTDLTTHRVPGIAVIVLVWGQEESQVLVHVLARVSESVSIVSTSMTLARIDAANKTLT